MYERFDAEVNITSARIKRKLEVRQASDAVAYIWCDALWEVWCKGCVNKNQSVRLSHILSNSQGGNTGGQHK